MARPQISGPRGIGGDYDNWVQEGATRITKTDSAYFLRTSDELKSHQLLHPAGVGLCRPPLSYQSRNWRRCS